MRDSEDPNFDTTDTTDTTRNRKYKYAAVFLLGTGKIIASAALLQQNILGTLSHLKASEKIALGLSITSGSANAVSNGLTRYTAIYSKLFGDETTASQTDEMDLEPLTGPQCAVSWLIQGLGAGSLFFMSMNTQSAVQDAIFYYHNISYPHENAFSYKDDWWMIVPAAFVTGSGAISFIAFNLTRINKNAVNFARNMITGDICKNIMKIPCSVLIPVTVMATINILPNLGGNYYPTQKALVNFFGKENIGELYFKALLYGSLICGFTSNLFSMVGEAFNFLSRDQTSRVKKWLGHPITYIILMPILIDIFANGFGGFIANLDMLNNFLGNATNITAETASINASEEIAPIIVSILFTGITTFFYTLYQEAPGFDAAADMEFCSVPNIEAEDDSTPKENTALVINATEEDRSIINCSSAFFYPPSTPTPNGYNLIPELGTCFGYKSWG